jgi:hypothetical protein
MARVYPTTEERIERWKREGRGTGTFDTWNPWLHIGDFSSKGKVSRDPVTGPGGRLVHVLSAGERWMYLNYSFRPNVEGLQEQFPLDRDETLALANALNIAHPRDPESRVDIVMTTDLLVTYRVGGHLRQMALSAKPIYQLPSHNVAEHSELERRYWERRGIAWRYVTDSEKCIPSTLKANLELLYINRALDLQAEPLGYEGSLVHVCDVVRRGVLHCTASMGLEDFCVQLNREHRWPPGVAIRAALHLIASAQLSCEFARSYLPRLPVIAIKESSREGGSDQCKAA